MSFVVNGADWQFNGMDAPVVHSKVGVFLDFIVGAANTGETIWIGDDFQRRDMLEGDDLWSVFGRGGRLALSDQHQQEMTAWLMQAPYYADEEVWPSDAEEIDVSIDDEPVVANGDVAWVHHSVRAGGRVAVLSLSRSGTVKTVTGKGEASVFFAVRSQERQQYWRSLLSASPRGLEFMQELASKAYPEIYFSRRALSGADDLTGGYLAFRQHLQACFATLSDHGAWIFTAPPPALHPTEPRGSDSDVLPSDKLIENRFHGFALNVSPEHADVYKDRKCREAREVVVGEDTLYCEWHIKLEKHQNRIHIHAPTSSSGGKIVVGIIHSHLRLPGDKK